jgi:hypothetical protein
LNVQIPAPGSRGLAIIRKVQDGVEIVEVHVYSPTGQQRLTLDGTYFPGTYHDVSCARQDVSKALSDNPVGTVILDDIP